MPTIEQFYAFHHLPSDRPPFALGSASKDPWYHAFTHPSVFELVAPSTSFCFGEQGSGKTAIRLRCEQDLKQEKYFTVDYSIFHNATNEPNSLDHKREILSAVVTKFCRELHGYLSRMSFFKRWRLKRSLRAQIDARDLLEDM